MTFRTQRLLTFLRTFGGCRRCSKAVGQVYSILTILTTSLSYGSLQAQTRATVSGVFNPQLHTVQVPFRLIQQTGRTCKLSNIFSRIMVVVACCGPVCCIEIASERCTGVISGQFSRVGMDAQEDRSRGNHLTGSLATGLIMTNSWLKSKDRLGDVVEERDSSAMTVTTQIDSAFNYGLISGQRRR